MKLTSGMALVLTVALAFTVLLIVAIVALGVISLLELSMTKIAWRLFAAVGIGSFFALLVAAKYIELPSASEPTGEAHQKATPPDD